MKNTSESRLQAMYEVNAAPIGPSTSTVAQDCRLYGSERHVEWIKLGLKLGTKEWKLREKAWDPDNRPPAAECQCLHGRMAKCTSTSAAL